MKMILPEREEKEATLPGILMYAPGIISRKCLVDSFHSRHQR